MTGDVLSEGWFTGLDCPIESCNDPAAQYDAADNNLITMMGNGGVWQGMFSMRAWRRLLEQ